MLEFIFGLFVGCFIGWNVTKPKWSQKLQDKVVKFLNTPRE